jgi:hypothetical protein
MGLHAGALVGNLEVLKAVSISRAQEKRIIAHPPLC